MSLSLLSFPKAKVWRELRIQNESVNYTLKVWVKIRTLNLPLAFSRATKIVSISDFLPAKLDRGFNRWAEGSLRVFSQLERVWLEVKD